MTVDEILKTIRKTLNISQEQLARELEISFTTINRWENGKRKPSHLAKMRLTEYCADKGISKDIIDAIENTR